jgi:hypothetical protein
MLLLKLCVEVNFVLGLVDGRLTIRRYLEVVRKRAFMLLVDLSYS